MTQTSYTLQTISSMSVHMLVLVEETSCLVAVTKGYCLSETLTAQYLNKKAEIKENPRSVNEFLESQQKVASIISKMSVYVFQMVFLLLLPEWQALVKAHL